MDSDLTYQQFPPVPRARGVPPSVGPIDILTVTIPRARGVPAYPWPIPGLSLASRASRLVYQ